MHVLPCICMKFTSNKMLKMVIFLIGHYMYVEPKQYGSGSVAALVSPDMVGMPEACIAFNYFTSNLNGKLEVWLIDKGNPVPTLLDTYSAPFQSWMGAR